MKPEKHEGFPGQRLVVVPRPIVSVAIRQPLLKTLLPTDAGFYPRASRHQCTREKGCPEAVFIYCARGGGWCEVGERRHEVVEDQRAWREGILKTSIKLEHSPFEFERTLQLREDHLQFHYKLTNLAAVDEFFIWAIHPLLRLREGDELELPGSTRALFNGEAWIDAVASSVPQMECCKIFARPVRQGWAAIKNALHGDRLQFEWDPFAINTLGLWLTRGGWHGHHHFAIEPGNADHDSLAVAAGRQRCGVVAGGDRATWQLSVRAGL